MFKGRLMIPDDKVIDALREMHDKHEYSWVNKENQDVLGAILVPSYGIDCTLVL